MHKKRDENHQHIALKGIHINKSPAISPTNTLTPGLAERWQIDWQQIEAHKQQLIADDTLMRRLEEMYSRSRELGETGAEVVVLLGNREITRVHSRPNQDGEKRQKQHK